MIVERRQSPRHELGRIAKLTMGGCTAARYCLVVNISEGGVRISTRHFEVPDQFTLNFPGVSPEDDGAYKVIWRIDGDVGAMRISQTEAFTRASASRQGASGGSQQGNA